MSKSKAVYDDAWRRASRAESALLAVPRPESQSALLTLSAGYRAAGGSYEAWRDWSDCGRDVWQRLAYYAGDANDLYRAAYRAGWLDEDVAAEAAEGGGNG